MISFVFEIDLIPPFLKARIYEAQSSDYQRMLTFIVIVKFIAYLLSNKLL